MGTICAPLIADLYLLCYERDFMALNLIESVSEGFPSYFCILILKKLKLFKVNRKIMIKN